MRTCWKNTASAALFSNVANMATTFDPTALTPPNLAELLTKSGTKKITVADIKIDIAAGAPTNSDGTLNFVHYTAWLISLA